MFRDWEKNSKHVPIRTYVVVAKNRTIACQQNFPKNIYVIKDFPKDVLLVRSKLKEKQQKEYNNKKW